MAVRLFLCAYWFRLPVGLWVCSCVDCWFVPLVVCLMVRWLDCVLFGVWVCWCVSVLVYYNVSSVCVDWFVDVVLVRGGVVCAARWCVGAFGVWLFCCG